MEATGIEPVSESLFPKISPSAAVRLKFPHFPAERQAGKLGSLLFISRFEAHADLRSPLIDAFIPTAVLRVKTAA